MIVPSDVFGERFNTVGCIPKAILYNVLSAIILLENNTTVYIYAVSASDS